MDRATELNALHQTLRHCRLCADAGYDIVPGAVMSGRIGATILSLGTTTPEAFVSVMAAWMGNPGLALGNGVGSIIADTGLIFGLTCLLTRVPMNRFILPSARRLNPLSRQQRCANMSR